MCEEFAVSLESTIFGQKLALSKLISKSSGEHFGLGRFWENSQNFEAFRKLSKIFLARISKTNFCVSRWTFWSKKYLFETIHFIFLPDWEGQKTGWCYQNWTLRVRKSPLAVKFIEKISNIKVFWTLTAWLLAGVLKNSFYDCPEAIVAVLFGEISFEKLPVTASDH